MMFHVPALDYWRDRTNLVDKYKSCGVDILSAPDGLEAHPTRNL